MSLQYNELESYDHHFLELLATAFKKMKEEKETFENSTDNQYRTVADNFK